jgi:hypothetical protein
VKTYVSGALNALTEEVAIDAKEGHPNVEGGKHNELLKYRHGFPETETLHCAYGGVMPWDLINIVALCNTVREMYWLR